jgi:thiosulfate reductase cytochrome b subunit
LPIRTREVILSLGEALRFCLKHDDLLTYNAVQNALYAAVILIGIIQVLAGLALWKPVQFSWLLAIFYDFQGAGLVHFLGMTAIVMFMVVHILLALLVPKTLLAMVTGGPFTGDSKTPTAIAPQPGE